MACRSDKIGFIRLLGYAVLVISVSGCATVGRMINPLADNPPVEATLGYRDDRALTDIRSKEDTARKALTAMASYQRAHLPQPNKPVMQPAVVRIMWVPDHLNSHGDLVPAHYYYLKVLKERWAVTDAFELEKQLQTGGDSSSIPYVYTDDRSALAR